MEEQIELSLSESQLRLVRQALMSKIVNFEVAAGPPSLSRLELVGFEKTLEEITRQYLGEYA